MMLWPKSCISYTLLAVFSVGLLATTGDITMTWTSPIYPKLYSNDSSINPLGRPITESEDGWIGSLITIGAMIGPLPFGFIAEKFGRKVGLVCLAIPHFIAYITLAFAKNIYLFYFARVFGGLAEGAGYSLMPMYIAEVAEDSKRGMYSVTLGIFWSIGSFIPYAIGPFLSIKSFHLMIACLPLLFVTTFSLVGPETPYHLVGANKVEEAEKVLMLLRSQTKDEVQQELNHIRRTLATQEQGKISDIFKVQGLRKALIISILFVSFQQLSGWNAVTFYLQPIFDASGTKISSDLSSLASGICILLSSLIVPFIIEKSGRKPLAVVSAFGMTVALALLAFFFYIKENGKSTKDIFWLPLFSLVLLIFFFQIGMSIIPWTVSSELFPQNVRQISASAASSACWISAFLMTKSFNDMKNAFGTGGIFVLFASTSFLCGIFVILFVPETKGKSFMQIQEMLKRKVSVYSQ